MKQLLYSILFCSVTFWSTSTVFAVGQGGECGKTGLKCDKGLQCQYFPATPTQPFDTYQCVPLPTTGPVGVFGKIDAPPALEDLGFGSIGISSFVNALIRLIYMLAAVIFVFMLLWGAIEWLMSGGDKEKVGSAQKRLTNAIIGIILLGVVFAILDLIGIFTGFTFFN